MAFNQWKNIKEGIKFLIFRNFIRRNFTGDDFLEYSHNDFEILDLKIGKFKSCQN